MPPVIDADHDADNDDNHDADSDSVNDSDNDAYNHIDNDAIINADNHADVNADNDAVIDADNNTVNDSDNDAVIDTVIDADNVSIGTPVNIVRFRVLSPNPDSIIDTNNGELVFVIKLTNLVVTQQNMRRSVKWSLILS